MHWWWWWWWWWWCLLCLSYVLKQCRSLSLRPETPHLYAKTMTESWHCQKITVKNLSLKKETWETWKDKKRRDRRTQRNVKTTTTSVWLFSVPNMCVIADTTFSNIDISLPTLAFVDATTGFPKLRDLWFLIRFLYFPIANCFMQQSLSWLS